MGGLKVGTVGGYRVEAARVWWELFVDGCVLLWFNMGKWDE